MSAYEFPISEERFPSGKMITTIHSSDGSGDDRNNQFHLYSEDVPRLIRALMEYQGIDVRGDDHLRELLGM